MRIVAIGFGIEYFIVAILMLAVFWKYFNLLKQELMVIIFAEFYKMRSSMKCLSFIFIVTYLLRGFMFFFIGEYHNYIPSTFERYELYFIVSTLLEVPNLIWLYTMHYKDFKDFGILNSQDSKIDSILVVSTRLEMSFQDEYRRRINSSLIHFSRSTNFFETD